MYEKEVFEKVKEDILKKINWEPVEEWTDSNYKALSKEIFIRTKISISTNTLKRIFGRIKNDKSYNPQQATKEALAQFLGFERWVLLLESYNKGIKTKNKRLYIPKKISLVVLSGVFLFGIIYFQLYKVVTPFKSNSDQAELISNIGTGNAPLTVQLKYNFPSKLSDTVTMDFGYNKHYGGYPEIILDKTDGIINHCFQGPGIYYIKLKSGNKTLKSTQVQVKSKGWVTYLMAPGKDELERHNYIKQIDNLQFKESGLSNLLKDKAGDGMHYISSEEIFNAGFNPNQRYYLMSLNIKDIEGVDLDNFQLNSIFKNAIEDGGISCFDIGFYVFGDRHFFSILFTQEGCYRWAKLQYGGNVWTGENSDLSKLGINLKNWNELKVMIKEKQVSIMNNGEVLLKDEYAEDGGKIKGLGIFTKGSGKIKKFEISSIDGKVVFDSEF